MRKNETIPIQMSKEEAKMVSSAIMEAIDQVEEMYETLDDLFELLEPVIMFADRDDTFDGKPEGTSKEEDDLCENCDLPCESNPNMQKAAPVQEEESEEEALAIEMLKAVFSAVTDLIENGE